MARPVLSVVTVAILWSRSSPAICEDLDDPAPDPVKTAHPGPPWNGYEGERFSIRIGGGALFDYNAFKQDTDSENQFSLGPESGLRDLRGLAAGRLYWPSLTYTIGYMYRSPIPKDKVWGLRQTGLRLQIPALGGNVFVGRTKEGFSTNKMMVGYYGWMNERAAVNDAFLPILNDGVRWTASVLGGKLVYNVGGFFDRFSESESYNKNDWTFAARAVWLPFAGGESTRVLHLAGEVRYAGANDGFLQYKSRPESWFGPSDFLDTGKFEASRSLMTGVEAYYTDGPLSVGGEYFFNHVSSDATNDPFLHGGEIFAAYMLTGETHPYNGRGGIFDSVVPARSTVKGGPGAWELVVRLSYADLDSEGVSGGKFVKVTPLLNWYISETLRFEAAYGYGVLDRDGLQGATHFFQTRVQVAIPTI